VQLDLGQRRVVQDEVKVREAVLAAPFAPRLESGRDQSIGGGIELAGGHEQVHVARLAQPHVAMHRSRKERSLQRQSRDAATGEQLHDTTSSDFDSQSPRAGRRP
jgi:hypothetical protein